MGIAKAIVITGTPGVGKSTIARMLAEELGACLIELGDLVVEKGLYMGLDEERASLIVDTRALATEVAKMLSGDQEHSLFIVVSHYAQDVVPKEAVLMAFVLRRSPYELKRVLAERGYGERKIIENVQAEVLDVCLVEALETYGPGLIYEVDTTGRAPEDVISEMLQAIEKGAGGRVGVVDWLGMLERDGRLEEFFPLEAGPSRSV